MIIGLVRLDRLNRTDRNIAYSIDLFGTEFCEKEFDVKRTDIVFDIAFKKLKLYKVYLRAVEYNKSAINFFKKCGFRLDGILRENAFINGKWENDIIMITRNPLKSNDYF